ncbi:uncharacterized protein YprB with RNaseH-like and TPR domain [Clostridiales Family XIII bacterium PM5-7]
MKKIIEPIQLKKYNSKILDLYFKDKSYAVFDIETTGLSPSTSQLILSGMLLVRGDQGEFIQIFADQVDDEKAVITETLAVLNTVDYLVTYNGKHFDLPFLERRAKHYGLDYDTLPYNLDLYLVINGHSSLREVLPNLKQKSIEVFMGLSHRRDDEISGAESVALYYRYMETKSFALEQKILLHNHDDVMQLQLLLPILAKVDIHRALFNLGLNTDDFLITKIRLSGHDLLVHGTQKSTPINYMSFPTEETPYALIMNQMDRSFQLTIIGESSADAVYIDASALLSDTKGIEKYPSYTDGYLILKQRGNVNYLEINAFLIAFFDANISALI